MPSTNLYNVVDTLNRYKLHTFYIEHMNSGLYIIHTQLIQAYSLMVINFLVCIRQRLQRKSLKTSHMVILELTVHLC